MHRLNPFVPIPQHLLKFRYHVRPCGVPIIENGQELIYSSPTSAICRLFDTVRWDRASSLDMGDRIAYFFFYEEERHYPQLGAYRIEIKMPYQVYVTVQAQDNPPSSISYNTGGYRMIAPTEFDERLAHETLIVVRDYLYNGHEVDIIPYYEMDKTSNTLEEVKIIKC